MTAYPPDGSRPWWRDWHAWLEPVWGMWHRQLTEQGSQTTELHALLNEHVHDVPIRFVPQSVLSEGQSYEGFIHAHRQVPTRDNLHDFFNACCWRRFPRTKARLNALQAEVIDREGVGATRGPLRDALTLFDENVLLLQAPPMLWEALRQHDWHTLLVKHRQDWCPSGLTPPDRSARLRPVVFGHALLEKLCEPYKAVTAHVFWVDPQLPAVDGAWDDWLAQRLTASLMASKPFQPLPVLGIPGWCEDNQDPAYYDDLQVFRPLSTRAQSAG